MGTINLDGIKAHFYADEDEVRALIRKIPHFEFKGKVTTGEVFEYPLKAKFQGLVIDVYKKSKQARVCVRGSLHKFKNRGGENDDTFSILELYQVLNQMKGLGLAPERLIIDELEVGVNQKTDIGLKELKRSALTYLNQPLEGLSFQSVKGGDIGVHRELSEKELKIYYKNIYQGNKQGDNLRIELKANLSYYRKRIVGKTLLELVSPNNLKELVNELRNAVVEDCLFYDGSIDTSKLTPVKRKKFDKLANPKTWETGVMNHRGRSRNKKWFLNLIAQKGGNKKIDDLFLRLDEVAKNSIQELEKCCVSNAYLELEKCSVSNCILEGQKCSVSNANSKTQKAF